mmetsp:Transcript_27348/g.88318  ORF Transcript_27348/g.88318 Transcript_27348/m.88318 type:complete len:228 (-) Transcript_27348:4119-4802(-)
MACPVVPRQRNARSPSGKKPSKVTRASICSMEAEISLSSAMSLSSLRSMPLSAWASSNCSRVAASCRSNAWRMPLRLTSSSDRARSCSNVKRAISSSSSCCRLVAARSSRSLRDCNSSRSARASASWASSSRNMPDKYSRSEVCCARACSRDSSIAESSLSWDSAATSLASRSRNRLWFVSRSTSASFSSCRNLAASSATSCTSTSLSCSAGLAAPPVSAIPARSYF